MKNFKIVLGLSFVLLLLFSCQKQPELIIVEETVEESTNYELRKKFSPCGPVGFDVHPTNDPAHCVGIYGGIWWRNKCIICR